MKVSPEPQPPTSRRRTSLGFLAAIGVAAIALLTIVNYYGLTTTSSSSTVASSVGSSNHASTMDALEQQQRSSKMLEEILSMLRTKHFIDVANGTDDTVTSPDVVNLRETEKLLERAEELLAEKLLRDEREQEPASDHQQLEAAATDEQRSTASELFPAEHDGSNVHIVFSMSCGHRNRLVQQTVLQLTAAWAGQKGPITQILSGCSDEERAKVMLEPTFYYDFRRHFTPNFAVNPEPGYEDTYMAYNKPFGLRHFLLNAIPAVKHEAIALIDGDFYFFRPLEINTGRNVSLYYAGSRDRSLVNDSVVDSVALAQDWTNVNKAGFYTEEKREMLDAVCGGLPCGNVSFEDAIEYYANIGPPYVMTLNDMKRFVDDYCHLCVTSRTVSTEWMTEMFAYSVAAANNGIKHTALTNLGISTPRYAGGNHEYWEFVSGSMANPCEDNLEFVEPHDPPVAIHTCQWIHNYYKNVIPDTIGSCESPMLKNLPPTEWTEIDTKVEEPLRRIRRQEVWAKCTLIKTMNRALTELKQRMCPEGFNTFRSIDAVHTR